MLGVTSACPTYSPRSDCAFAASVFQPNCLEESVRSATKKLQFNKRLFCKHAFAIKSPLGKRSGANGPGQQERP